MDNNQMEELQRAMEEFNSALRGMSSNLSGLSQAEIQAKRELDAYKKSIKDAKDVQDKWHDRIKKGTDGVVNFAKSAASSANSFDVLKDAISVGAKAVSSLVGLMPVVGGALKAFGESAGDVAKMMVDQFQTGWSAYKELADVGLAGSFEDMKDSAASTGLLFQDLSKAVGKYSTDLSNLGAGTAQGMKKFREVSAVLDDQKVKYARMGIGIDEFTEYQAKFMAQETRQGRAKNMTAEQLAKGTTAYIDQLDMLSKLTGASRKDLQAQRDAAQSETKFASATELMDTGVKKMFEDMNVLIANKGGPSLAQGFRDLASGSVSTDAAKQLMLQSGGMANDIVEKLRNGSIKSLAEGFTELQKSMKENLVPMAEVGQHIGDGSLYTKSFSELRKMVNAGTISEEDLKRVVTHQDKLKAGTDASVAQTKALADTTVQLNKTASNLQLLFTSSTMVTKSMDMLSSSMEEFSAWALEKAGVELPEDLKARRELRKAINEEAKLKEEQITREKEKESLKTMADGAQKTALQQKYGAEDVQYKARKIIGLGKYSSRDEEIAAELEANKEKIQKAQGRLNAAKINGGTSSQSQQQPQQSAVDAIIATIKDKESSGRYGVQNSKPNQTASGAFQFIDKTWQSLTKQHGIGQEYKSAKLAPDEIQDAIAKKYVEDILKRANGDVSKVPLEWYTGNLKGEMTEEQLRVNKGLTASEYQADWMKKYKKFAPVSDGTDTKPKSAPGAGRTDLGKEPPPVTSGTEPKVKARRGWDGVFEGPDAGYNPDLELHGKETVSIKPATDKTNEKIIALLEKMIAKQEDLIDLADSSNSHQRKLVNATT